MSFHNLSISVLKVGRQLAGSLAVAAFFLLGGCFKEEEPVKPYDRGNVTTRSISLASDYRYQVFFNLDADSVIRRNLKSDWDIAFECSDTEGGKAYLNSANFMSCWKTDKADIDQLTDTVGFFKNRAMDAANRPDSFAIGDVQKLKKPLWIDRGYDSKGDQLDFYKIQFISVDAKKYVIKVAKDNGGKAQTFEVLKDPTKNFVHFSFSTLKAVTVEPPTKDWDLQFTQYVHTFSDPYLSYLVTGVILNPNNTTAIADSSLEFKKIDINVAKGFKLSPKSDVIGYNWKNFINNVYSINSHWNYIIRDSKGFYYKLHFIDFYNEVGSKGFPKFEFQKL
jgi:HmuY protein